MKKFRYWPPITPTPSTTNSTFRSLTPDKTPRIRNTLATPPQLNSAEAFAASCKLAHQQYSTIDEYKTLKCTAAMQLALSNDVFLNNTNEIIPHLFLGTKLALSDITSLLRQNIETIIQPTTPPSTTTSIAITDTLSPINILPKQHSELFNHIIWPLKDNTNYPIIWVFPQMIEAISKSLLSNKSVLIIEATPNDHVSKAIVAAYLMARQETQETQETQDTQDTQETQMHIDQALELIAGKTNTTIQNKHRASLVKWRELNFELTDYYATNFELDLKRLPKIKRCFNGDIQTEWIRERKIHEHEK